MKTMTAELLPGHGQPGSAFPSDSAMAASIGLWVFLGVVTALFSLFILTYVMRMSESDATTLALPWQLWLSTGLLAASSLSLEGANQATHGLRPASAWFWLRMGGVFALAFLAAQGWAWRQLLAAQVLPAGNPAGSFFYLLTAMHGLHVLGGLVGWMRTVRAARHFLAPNDATDTVQIAWCTALCARYWHFMLAVWLVLFAMLGWLTPEVARIICGTA